MIKKTFYIDVDVFNDLKKVSKNEKITLNTLIKNILDKELSTFKPLVNFYKITKVYRPFELPKHKLQVTLNTNINKKLQFTSKKYDLKETEIIRQILNKYNFNKSFLLLDKHLYFNMSELLNKKKTMATNKAPINNLHEYCTLTSIPINLDVWSKKHNTYCYNDNINKHKGFLFEYVSNNMNFTNILNYKVIYFEYTLKNNIETVNINLIDIDDYLLNYPSKNGLYDGLISENKMITKLFNKNNYSFEKYIKDTDSLRSKEIDTHFKEMYANELFFQFQSRFINRWFLRPYKIEKINDFYMHKFVYDNKESMQLNYNGLDIHISTIDLSSNFGSVLFTPNNYIKLLLLCETFLKEVGGKKPIFY